MAYRRKHILVLFCGGTTIDERDRVGDSVRRLSDVEGWMAAMGEMALVADVTPQFVYGGEGAAIGASQWTELAAVISREYKRYDGFFILHSLDTIAYSAIALAFMLQKLEKPVVLTGSPIPSKEERSSVLRDLVFQQQRRGLGAKMNLMNALQVAVSDLAEVCVVYGSRIYRASTLVLTPSRPPQLFDAVDGNLLGKIDFGTKFLIAYQRRGSRAFRVFPKVDTDIVEIDYRPGTGLTAIERALRHKPHGIFVKTTETAALPSSFLAILKRAHAGGTPVIVYTPRLHRRDGAYPFIIIDQMSPLAALMKVMWARGQTTDVRKLKKMLQQEVAQEHVTHLSAPL